jgi:hypothetical protein
MKFPAIQFYVKDWKNNLKLRRCSDAAKGAWIEIMCALHDSEEYGVARMPLKELAKVAGVKLKSARELVDKSVLKGGDANVSAFIFVPKHANKKYAPVTLLDATNGPLWYSSRMVRDEYVRQRRGAPTRFPQAAPQKPSPKPSPKPHTKPPIVPGPAVAVALDISSSSDRSREGALGKAPGDEGFEHLKAKLPANLKRAIEKRANGHDPAELEQAPEPRPIQAPRFRLGDDLPPNWRESPDSIDHAGETLGMARISFEDDLAYAQRIEARLNLDRGTST